MPEPRADDRRAGDPLERLRLAWGALEVPPPLDDVEDGDPRTRAVVACLRTAWGALPVPEARLRARAPRPVPALRRLASAALVLASLGSAGTWLWRAGGPGDGTFPEVPARAGGDGPRIAALSPDHLELRRGAVRLVLVDGASNPPAATPAAGDRERPRTPATGPGTEQEERR